MKYLLLVIFIFSISMMGWSQSSKGELKIIVWDLSLTAIENINIQLFSQGSTIQMNGKSDSLGVVVFKNLKEGAYSLIILGDGFHEKELKKINVEAGMTKFIDIRIETEKEYENRIYESQVCKYNREKWTPKCHICKKKKNVIPYSYGLPTSDAWKAEQEGELNYKIGGCVVKSCKASWYCTLDSVAILLAD